MYRTHLLDPAERELERLDKHVARRIFERLNWLAANVHQIKLEALKGPFLGFYKLRVGDFRVVYEILHDEETILVHAIGHRSIVYRRL
jgi:mRNA interferase RelE/StbE